MKNADITKIRQLLKDNLKYYTNKDGQSTAPFSVYQRLKEALALLPCETCGGAGQIAIPREDTPGVDWESCSDCQS